jgi:sugar lactone lactonase YvrE
MLDYSNKLVERGINLRKTGILLTIIAMLASSIMVPDSKTDALEPTPDVIGKLPPLGSYLGPTFLHFDGPRIFVSEDVAKRVQGLYPRNDYTLGVYGQHNGQLASPSGVTTYKGISYICDQYSNKILMYDREAKYLGEFKVYDTSKKQLLNQPRGIAQYQGKLFIANAGGSNIIVSDNEGRFIDVWPKSTGDEILVEPTGITVSADKIFVTDPTSDKIFVYDLAGKFVATIKSAHYWAVYGGENKIAATDPQRDHVYVYNASDFSLIGEFGETGSKPGQLSKPMGVAIFEDKIYVSSYNNNRIDIFDQTGKHLGIHGLESKDAAGSMGYPTDIAVSGEDVFIADSARNKILAYKKNGSFVREFGQFGSGDGDLDTPSGIAISDDNIYIADTGNSCIKVFSRDGSYIKTIGSFGAGEGKFNKPSDLSVVKPAGKLFICDTGNNLIQEFTLDGEFIRQIGGYGSNPGKFNNPTGIAADGTRLIVADSVNCRIQEFQVADLTYQRSYGAKGRGTDKLFYPTKCVFDESGKIYVSDTYNHRIQIFDSKTEFSYVYGLNGGPKNTNYMTPAVCPEEDINPQAIGWFNFPQGIAIDDFGCFVADTLNHRIQYVEFQSIFTTRPFVISPSHVDFGVVGNGQDAVQKLAIKNLSGGSISGIVEIPEKDRDWLKTHNVSFSGDAAPIELYVNAQATAGAYETDVTIITNKDRSDINTKIHVKATIGENFGYTIDMDPFINVESSDRIDIPLKITNQNNYIGNVALEVLQPPPNTYGQFSNRLLNLSKQNDSVLTIKSSKAIGKGIYKVQVKAISPQIKYETIRDITIFVNRNKSFENRTVLIETFTAKWCINCPYAHRAAERLLEERGEIVNVPLMYYVESRDDNAEPYLYYLPADNRYAWYGKSGLPTSYFDGQNSLVGGDNDVERKKPPKDKLPCDRFSGTSFTYNRYGSEVTTQIQSPSPLSMFVESTTNDGFIDVDLTIETLAQIDSKNLFLYVVLTEDNLFDPGVNGDEYHNLVVREMYTSEKGEPINLVTGSTFKKSMHLRIPSYVNENNARLVVWVQRNTSKEVLQTSAVRLNYQGIKNSIIARPETNQLQVEIDKESSVRYFITNSGTRTEKITLKPRLSTPDWEWYLRENGKELPKAQSVITLEPMGSTTITLIVKPPKGFAEGSRVDFNLGTFTNPINGFDNTVQMFSIPKLPPDFAFAPSENRIDITRRMTKIINVPIKQINEFDGVVTLSNCTTNPSLMVEINPVSGIPPFEATLTVKGGEELNFGNHKICILATGITTNGETLEHKLELPVNILQSTVVLEANPRKVISCSENQSCHSTNVDVKINSPIEVSECKFSVRYDPTVLTTSHRNLGSFFGPDATIDFIDRSSEGLITVHIKGKLSKGDGLLCSIMMRGVKGVSKAGSQIEVCDVYMYDSQGRSVLTNIGCTAEKVDIISQIAPPVLTCDAKEGDVLDQEMLVLKGNCKVTDPDYHVTLTINGRPVVVKADGSWEYIVKLREGKNTFVLIARDETGGSTGLKFNITRDSTPPEIGVTNIKDNGHTRNPFFELEGWVDEKVQLTINDEPVEQDQYKEFRKALKLVKGPNTITIKAVDQLGKTVEKTITIWLDSKTVLNLWLGQAKYTVDGKEFKLATAPTSSSPPLPKEFAGNTFMPIREVAEALGATIAWDAAEKKVTITQSFENKSRVIELWIGKKKAMIDQAEVRIDEKNKLYPVIIASKTLLPLRFVATALGAKVEYVAAEKKIVLTYPTD